MLLLIAVHQVRFVQHKQTIIPYLSPLSHPSTFILLPSPLPLEVGPLNTARRIGERCKYSGGHRVWCILALRSDIATLP